MNRNANRNREANRPNGNEIDPRLQQQWWEAVQTDNQNAMQRLVMGHPAIVNTYNEDGMTALMYIIYREGNEQLIIDNVRMLLSWHANPNLQDQDDGNTALHYAIYLKNWDIIGVLLSKRADMNIRNNYEVTPFMALISEYVENHRDRDDYYNMIELFFNRREKPLNPNIPDNNGKTPLIILLDGYEDAERNEVEDFQNVFRILHNHINPNYVTTLITPDGEPSRMTPLMYACKEGFYRGVKLLIEEFGANVNLGISADENPLSIATHAGYLGIINLLVQHGARPERLQLVGPDAVAEEVEAEAEEEAEEEKMDPEEKAIRNRWFQAMKNEKKSNITQMMKNGINVNMLNAERKSALLYAVMQNNFELARLILANSKNPNIVVPKTGISALMIAIMKLSQQQNKSVTGPILLLIEELIKRTNLDLQNKAGETALHYAVALRQDKVLQMLLNKGANPNILNGIGMTPLLMVCDRPYDKEHSNVDYKMLQSLLKDRRINKDIKSKRGFTPLSYAIMNNQEAFVNKLLQQGADPNIPNEDGSLPIFQAIEDKTGKILTLLLKKGVIVDALNKSGETPLLVALQKRNTKVASILLKAGANPTIVSNKGLTPFWYLLNERTYFENRIEHIRLMIQNGANIDEKNPESDETPLIYAIKHRDNQLIHLLVEMGADVNIPTSANVTPLMLASIRETHDIVRLLIDHGARRDYVDKNNFDALAYVIGNAVLHKKSGEEIFDIVDTLLNWKSSNNSKDVVNINFQFKDGSTPLLHAINVNLVGVDRLLLEAGANPNYRTKNGTNPLELAIIQNDIGFIRKLVEKGALPSARIQDMVSEGQINNQQILALLREKFQIAPRPDLWVGWSKTDVDAFDTVFLAELPANATPNQRRNALRQVNSHAICPICLRYVVREDGCMYMNHNCKAMGGYYHKELYEKYKLQNGVIVFCTICCRICGGNGHQHHELVDPSAPTAPLYPQGGEYFENDCTLTQYGGGVIEKGARFIAMRDKAIELNQQIGKMSREKALNQIVESAWLAAKATSIVPSVRQAVQALEQGQGRRPPANAEARYPPADPELRRSVIRQLEGRRYNVPKNRFPEAKGISKQFNENATRINVLRPEPNHSNPALMPTIHRYGFNAVMQSNVNENDYDSKEDEDKMIQFHHRNKNGDINNHENQYIERDVLESRLRTLNERFYIDEDAGYCPIPGCGGLLYPEEIKSIMPADVYEPYRVKFNNKFAEKAGGSRMNNQATNHKNHSFNRMMNSQTKEVPFFSPITNAACFVAPGRNEKVIPSPTENIQAIIEELNNRNKNNKNNKSNKKNHTKKKGGVHHNRRRNTRKGMIMYPRKKIIRNTHKTHKTHKTNKKYNKGKKPRSLRRKTKRS